MRSIRLIQPRPNNLYATAFEIICRYDATYLREMVLDLMTVVYYSPSGFVKRLTEDDVLTCTFMTAIQWPTSVPFGRTKHHLSSKSCLKQLKLPEVALKLEFLIRQYEFYLQTKLMFKAAKQGIRVPRYRKFDPQNREFLDKVHDTLEPYTVVAQAMMNETFSIGITAYNPCADGSCPCYRTPFAIVRQAHEHPIAAQPMEQEYPRTHTFYGNVCRVAPNDNSNVCRESYGNVCQEGTVLIQNL